MPRGRVEAPTFRYYKFIRRDGTSPYQNYGWPMPTKNEDGTWEPGEWVTFDMDPVLCRGGLHFVRSDQEPAQWISHRLFEAEVDPAGADVGDNKVAVKKARLIREIEQFSSRWSYEKAGFNQGFGKRWKDRKVEAWLKKKVPPEIRAYIGHPERKEKLMQKRRMVEARELHARGSAIEKRITNDRCIEILRAGSVERQRIQAIFDQLYALNNVPLEAVLAGSKIRKHWYARVPKREELLKRRIAHLEIRRRAIFRSKSLAGMEAELADADFFFRLVKAL